MSGYIRAHRSVLGHPAFRNDAESMAFMWMVMRAAWKRCRVRYKERTIILERGQLAVSQRDMANALDRDKGWVERLWTRLKSEAMIAADTKAGVAVITICNYEQYQTERDNAKAAAKAPDGAGARQGQGTEQEREEREEDNITAPKRAKHPLPDDWNQQPFGEGSDAAAIVAGWSDADLKRQVEAFRDHHRARANKFSDWQAAWGTWVRNSVQFGRPASNGPKPEPGSVEANAAYCRKVADEQRREREWRERQGKSAQTTFEQQPAAASAAR